jgi:hypothetical protein
MKVKLINQRSFSMKLKENINPQLLAGAVGLLQPCCPELTAETLVEVIKRGIKKKAKCEKEFLTIREYAAKYKICTMTVRRMLDRGELQCERVGKRCVRILMED